ncbi:hypothetical protein R3P38DRAFT_2773255 [Favolaschia claudopus]|uniref:Uncharacterized protein n=1 Tax=Favolaschia claudopus TaxID=2862362 RepID=A0AAW0BZQ4_9AGAR
MSKRFGSLERSSASCRLLGVASALVAPRAQHNERCRVLGGGRTKRSHVERAHAARRTCKLQWRKQSGDMATTAIRGSETKVGSEWVEGKPTQVERRGATIDKRLAAVYVCKYQRTGGGGGTYFRPSSVRIAPQYRVRCVEQLTAVQWQHDERFHDERFRVVEEVERGTDGTRIGRMPAQGTKDLQSRVIDKAGYMTTRAGPGKHRAPLVAGPSPALEDAGNFWVCGIDDSWRFSSELHNDEAAMQTSLFAIARPDRTQVQDSTDIEGKRELCIPTDNSTREASETEPQIEQGCKCG